MPRLIEITGKALSGEWGIEDTQGNGIKVLRTTNFTNYGKINYSGTVTRIINKKNLSEKYLRQGDIIIEKSGGSDKQPVGRVVFFEGEENTYLFNNFSGLLRVKNTEIWFPKYVFYALYANYLKGGTKKYENKTTGLHNLKIDDYINKVEIESISWTRQKKICEILDTISSIIDKRNQQLEQLDLLIKSRFVEMFGDISNKSSNELPMTELCSIIDGDRGKNYPKQEEFFDNEYCLFLNAKNVTANGFDFSNCQFITKEKDACLRKGKLSYGDIVLTTRGTIGNMAYYTEQVPFNNIRINSGMVILRMHKEMINEIFFIEQFKLKLYEIKKKIASGTAQPQLPISTMGKIKLVVPKIEHQKEFAQFVVQIEKAKSAVQNALDEAQLLFDSLMQEYFG